MRNMAQRDLADIITISQKLNIHLTDDPAGRLPPYPGTAVAVGPVYLPRLLVLIIC
jgi:hypothetical protein